MLVSVLLSNIAGYGGMNGNMNTNLFLIIGIIGVIISYFFKKQNKT